MRISSHHEYAASLDEVYAMMIDPAWLTEVTKNAGASSCEASGGGNIATVMAKISAPDEVKRLTGPTLSVNQQFEWRKVDHGYDATLRVGVERLPSSMMGTATLRPSAKGTTITYDCQFNITVPLLGRKLERAAEPELTRIVEAHYGVGDEWLASH